MCIVRPQNFAMTSNGKEGRTLTTARGTWDRENEDEPGVSRQHP